MILDDLSFKLIEERMYELDKEIEKAQKFVKEKKDLEKYRLVLEVYRTRKATAGGPRSTEQNERAVRWFQRYPYLALYKGESMIQKEICRYSDEKSQDKVHGQVAHELQVTGIEKTIHEYLKQFCDGQPLNPFDLSNIKTQRVNGAPEVIDFEK